MAVIFGIVFGLDIVIGVLYLVQIDLALTNIHNYWRCIWSDLSLYAKTNPHFLRVISLGPP